MVYKRLNSKFLKAFAASKTKNPSGKTSSFKHIQKYFNTVQWGAKEANVMLPVSFFQGKEKFLSAYKKQVANDKKKGNVDENEANPIPINLYQLICSWAVKEGNILVWLWTIMQWNLMAQSVNIEPIALHNIKVFQDSLQFLYDVNKSDQKGSKTTTNHIYANPKNDFICPYLALEIYFCLNAAKFTTLEYIFKQSEKEKKKVVSQGYCSQLRELFNCYATIMMNFIRLAHGNAHGWRKGATMYATSGTTCPPPSPWWQGEESG